MKVVTLVPRRADGGHRDRLWCFVKNFWQTEMPSLELHEGHHLDGPFNRSLAINRAAEEADLLEQWEVAVIADSDTIPTPHQVDVAIDRATLSGRLVIAYDRWQGLTSSGTRQVLAGYTGSWDRFVYQRYTGTVSSCIVVPRSLWDKVGGFDVGFEGWGFEDVAFWAACKSSAGEPLRVEGPVWHLWHPTTVERNPARAEYRANEERVRGYIEAAGMADRPRFRPERIRRPGSTGRTVR